MSSKMAVQARRRCASMSATSFVSLDEGFSGSRLDALLIAAEMLKDEPMSFSVEQDEFLYHNKLPMSASTSSMSSSTASSSVTRTGRVQSRKRTSQSMCMDFGDDSGDEAPARGSDRSGSFRPSKRRTLKSRELHKQLEKDRRAHVKECFDQLQQAIPATAQQSRQSNINMLSQATAYIHALKEKNSEQDALLEQLRSWNQFCKQQLRLRVSGSVTPPPVAYEDQATSPGSSSVLTDHHVSCETPMISSSSFNVAMSERSSSPEPSSPCIGQQPVQLFV